MRKLVLAAGIVLAFVAGTACGRGSSSGTASAQMSAERPPASSPSGTALAASGTALAAPGTALAASGTALAAPAISSRAVASATGAASGPPVASVSASAPSAARPSPCPPGAHQNKTARICLTPPSGVHPKSWEELENEGTEELYDKEEHTLRITWASGRPKLDRAALKASVESVERGGELVASGELPGGGFWAEARYAEREEKVNYAFSSVVQTGRLLVNCFYSVPEAKADAARSVCKSMRVY